MERKDQRTEKVVFGLDLGTRSVVGTVGYMESGRFYCVAQRVKEHETRSMLDGQIHDIGRVAATIRQVKSELEEATNIELTEVCIAAAGRVLKTVHTKFSMEFPDGHTVTDEDVYHLESGAVEQAYQVFLENQQGDSLKYYLVGYSTMHYYLNDYQIANLEGHDAGRVAVDLIATFLPDDVVDGLYKACERAGLTVSNLTLEPIAAIEVAIPKKYRMLNLALIDVGAGTSDICITNDGAIVAYGMLPVAGDHITEVVAKHCLVDFNTGDEIKIKASMGGTVEYTDIMGLSKTIDAREILRVVEPTVRRMAAQVADEIKRLNGGGPVSAIFVVGGGGKIPGYAQAVANSMGLPDERVALRGEEVMKDIIFMSNDGIERDSRLVTPLGICMGYYASNNNFVFVNFNGEQVKLYDNGRLAIGDVAMQVKFPNEDLFPKRGKDLVFTINGKERIVRGRPGESAEILLNGMPADIHAQLHGNDIIEVRRSTTGAAASMDIEGLPEFKRDFRVNVNGQDMMVTRVANVNGQLQSGFYSIRNGDDVRILDYDTAEQVAALLDIEIGPDTVIVVNNEIADKDTKVYENFKVEFKKQEDAVMDYYRNFPKAASGDQDGKEAAEDGSVDAIEQKDATKDSPAQMALIPENASPRGMKELKAGGMEGAEYYQDEPVKPPKMINVIVNGSTITMTGKSDYVFVDIFNYIDFDLKNSRGRAIVTQVNGASPDYMQTLSDGDKIEVYWKDGQP